MKRFCKNCSDNVVPIFAFLMLFFGFAFGMLVAYAMFK